MEPAGQLGGGGARSDRDGHAVLDGVRGGSGDRSLLGTLLAGLDRRVWFVAPVVSRDRAAVHLQ